VEFFLYFENFQIILILFMIIFKKYYFLPFFPNFVYVAFLLNLPHQNVLDVEEVVEEEVEVEEEMVEVVVEVVVEVEMEVEEEMDHQCPVLNHLFLNNNNNIPLVLLQVLNDLLLLLLVLHHVDLLKNSHIHLKFKDIHILLFKKSKK